MPTLPWKSISKPPPGTVVLVMASRLDVRSFKDVPRFFLRSLAAWRQVLGTRGGVGASLIADLGKRRFWTLSAWQDKDALYAYAKTEPHQSIMVGLRPTMRESVFTFWETSVENLPISWSEAKRRIQEQERADHDKAGA
ncbi:hypothetical protein ACIBL3_45730 [Kribbella sp. NPDC050124]|uniref:hypothetical protein n=1 Tax=Kribbella sp. NPDC050124 TaxID=3364114 RepID=UPI0037AF39EA